MIKRRRTELGLSQRELAKRVGGERCLHHAVGNARTHQPVAGCASETGEGVERVGGRVGGVRRL